MSGFKREERYLVLKWDDISLFLSDDDQNRVDRMCKKIAYERNLKGKRADSFVCVADDWPEYETVWAMIEARMTGQPDELSRLRAELATLKLKHEVACDTITRMQEQRKRHHADCVSTADYTQFTVEAANEFNTHHEEMLQEIDKRDATIAQQAERIKAPEAENKAIRILMDMYNLGGWTDSLRCVTDLTQQLAAANALIEQARTAGDALREYLTVTFGIDIPDEIYVPFIKALAAIEAHQKGEKNA